MCEELVADPVRRPRTNEAVAERLLQWFAQVRKDRARNRVENVDDYTEGRGTE